MYLKKSDHRSRFKKRIEQNIFLVQNACGEVEIKFYGRFHELFEKYGLYASHMTSNISQLSPKPKLIPV